MELLRGNAARNRVAFLESDVYRAFFHNEDPRIRNKARRGRLLISALVFVDVSLMAMLSVQAGRTNNAYLQYAKGLPDHWLKFHAVLIGVLLLCFAVNAAARYMVHKKYITEWRQVVTCRKIGKLRLALRVDQASQRIAESIPILLEAIVLELYVPFLRAVFVILEFFPLLWIYGKYFHHSFPGILVVGILGWCFFQTIISLWMGWPLISLQKERQGCEGELRSPLVHLEKGTRNFDNALEEALVNHIRGPLRDVYFKIIHREAYMEAWKKLNSQLCQGAQYALMVMAFFGSVENNFDTILMIAGAINASHDALSIGSEAATKLMMAKGTWVRISEFEASAQEAEQNEFADYSIAAE
jgi:ABC-type uncharacterized transport system fused permease/ATPase subunit